MTLSLNCLDLTACRSAYVKNADGMGVEIGRRVKGAVIVVVSEPTAPVWAQLYVLIIKRQRKIHTLPLKRIVQKTLEIGADR